MMYCFATAVGDEKVKTDRKIRYVSYAYRTPEHILVFHATTKYFI